MPTVPYNPVPTASPVSSPIPYRTDAGVSPTAFGANIGEAQQRLGTGIERGSDELTQGLLAQKQLDNQSAAKDAAVDGAVAIGNRTTEFYKLEGQDAVKGQSQFESDIKSIRENALQNLNPMAKRLADQELSRRIEFALIDAGRHTAQQSKVWNDHASQALEGTALADTGRDPSNEQRFQTNLGTLTGTVVDRAKNGGYLDSPQFERELDIEFGKAWQERITSIAQRDPIAAKDLYTKNIGQIKDPQVQASIERMLLTQMQNIGSSIRVNQATSGGDFVKQTIGAESAGDPFAKSRTSTAKGYGQIIDSTWDDLRRRHPELNLTPEGRSDIQQSTRAIQTLETEGKAALSAAGLDPNDKNTRMTYFLGNEGGVNFIKAMDTSPNMPAANVVGKKVADANREVFYDDTGRPRTLQEVYNNQTYKFGGPSTALTGRSSGEWLEQTRALGQQMAEHDMPGDPMYANKIDTGIISHFNTATNAARLTDRGNYNDLYSIVNGGGDPTKRVTDINVITQNPELNRVYEKLPPAMQDALYHRTIANSRQDNAQTQQNTNTFHSVMGMAISDPERFLNTDASTMGLTFNQQDKIFAKQQSMTGKSLNTNDINKALNDAIIKGMMRSQGWGPTPDKNDEGEVSRYNEFVGAFNEEIEGYKAQHKGEMMTPDEYRKIAANLLAAQSYSWWSGTVRNFQVPQAFKTQYHDALTQQLRREPNDQEWGSFRRYVLKRSAQSASTE